MSTALPELKRSLQSLAQPAEVQLQLYPDGVVKADELALDFDQWWTVASADPCVMSLEQHQALADVDRLLTAMSGSAKSEHWTEAALRSDPAWREVRAAAKRALAALGWSAERPPFRCR